MNSNRDPNKLQKLLAQWSEAEQPTVEAIDALTQRVQSALRMHTSDPTIPSEPTQESNHDRNGFTIREAIFPWATIASIAAVLVVCFSVWHLAFPTKGIPSPQLALEPSSKLAQDRSAKIKFLAEFQRMFENRISWIAETENGLWFDVDQESGDPPSPLMAIRLEICKPDGTRSLELSDRLWTMDIILKNQQVVEVRKGELQPEVVVWPYLMDDGLLALETSVNLSGSLPIQGQATSVFSLNTFGTAQKRSPIGDYELRQSVLLLDQPAI